MPHLSRCLSVVVPTSVTVPVAIAERVCLPPVVGGRVAVPVAVAERVCVPPAVTDRAPVPVVAMEPVAVPAAGTDTVRVPVAVTEPVAVPVAVGWGADGGSRLAAVRERVADPAAATKTAPIQAAITEPSPRSGNGRRVRRRTGGGHGTRSPFRRWSRNQSSVQTAITEPSRRSGDVTEPVPVPAAATEPGPCPDRVHGTGRCARSGAGVGTRMAFRRPAAPPLAPPRRSELVDLFSEWAFDAPGEQRACQDDLDQRGRRHAQLLSMTGAPGRSRTDTNNSFRESASACWATGAAAIIPGKRQ